MATGDVQVTITQVTKKKGTDFDDAAVIAAATFPATNTDVILQAVARATIPGDEVIYDIIAIGRVA